MTTAARRATAATDNRPQTAAGLVDAYTRLGRPNYRNIDTNIIPTRPVLGSDTMGFPTQAIQVAEAALPPMTRAHLALPEDAPMTIDWVLQNRTSPEFVLFMNAITKASERR